MNLITDQREGEPPFVFEQSAAPLDIRELFSGRTLLSVAAPFGGWSHEALCKALAIERARTIVREGADAYVGQQFVGSTEL
jgi:5'-deoxynucleotidase